MQIYVDDIRNPPDNSWIVVRSYGEAIALIDTHWGNIQAISLDHDLGEVKTGYDIVCHMELKARQEPDNFPPEVYFHTANPVGWQNMKRVLDSIHRFIKGAL